MLGSPSQYENNFRNKIYIHDLFPLYVVQNKIHGKGKSAHSYLECLGKITAKGRKHWSRKMENRIEYRRVAELPELGSVRQ